MTNIYIYAVSVLWFRIFVRGREIKVVYRERVCSCVCCMPSLNFKKVEWGLGVKFLRMIVRTFFKAFAFSFASSALPREWLGFIEYLTNRPL